LTHVLRLGYRRINNLADQPPEPVGILGVLKIIGGFATATALYLLGLATQRQKNRADLSTAQINANRDLAINKREDDLEALKFIVPQWQALVTQVGTMQKSINTLEQERNAASAGHEACRREIEAVKTEVQRLGERVGRLRDQVRALGQNPVE
jgi:peptidoglycan hydrolase CwlO-like protein